jgi:hypothetical protein
MERMTPKTELFMKPEYDLRDFPRRSFARYRTPGLCVISPGNSIAFFS